MVFHSFGILVQVIVQLGDLEVDRDLVGVRAKQRALEALDSLLWSANLFIAGALRLPQAHIVWSVRQRKWVLFGMSE